MKLFRIVQEKKRSEDLSGNGAFRFGGRWNSKGTFMLYTSETSSLAYLETLAHFDKILIPPKLFLIQLETDNKAPVFTLPDKDYPANWLRLGLLKNKNLGDKWMNEKKYLGIKVRSAINVLEHNILLNPLFPDYHRLVQVKTVAEIKVDGRIII